MDEQDLGTLVLQRRKGEVICIGNNIQITILDCNSGSTKVGITAPRDIKVYRKEIYDRIQSETDKEG